MKMCPSLATPWRSRTQLVQDQVPSIVDVPDNGMGLDSDYYNSHE